jgi:hypothetical protein
MAFRAVPAIEDEGRTLLQDILDRLDRLEGGSALRGQVSFDPVIQIGDVLFRVVDGVGTHRDVILENVLSGATYTITL